MGGAGGIGGGRPLCLTPSRSDRRFQMSDERPTRPGLRGHSGTRRGGHRDRLRGRNRPSQYSSGDSGDDGAGDSRPATPSRFGAGRWADGPADCHPVLADHSRGCDQSTHRLRLDRRESHSRPPDDVLSSPLPSLSVPSAQRLWDESAPGGAQTLGGLATAPEECSSRRSVPGCPLCTWTAGQKRIPATGPSASGDPAR